MCNDPQKAASWVRLITNNQRTSLECAKFFGMDPEDVNRHIYNHVNFEEGDDPNDPDYIRKKMIKFIKLVELWMDDMIIEGTPDRSTMDMLLKLMSEIRSNLRILGEVDGKLNRADPKLQIINIKNDFKQLTNVIMMEACDHCKPLMLNAIENMQVTETPQPKRLR